MCWDLDDLLIYINICHSSSPSPAVLSCGAPTPIYFYSYQSKHLCCNSVQNEIDAALLIFNADIYDQLSC